MRTRVTAVLVSALMIGTPTGVVAGQTNDEGKSSLHGTLNIVVANRSGFVMASDSKLTPIGHSGEPSWGQKLFRTGPRSALMIAGFYASHLNPFRYDIPELVVGRFGWAGLTDGRGTLFMAADWLEGVIGVRLTTLASIVHSSNQRQLTSRDFRFSAIFGDFDNDGVPLIKKVRFEPSFESIGRSKKSFPVFDKPDVETFSGDHFILVTAGVDQGIKEILSDKHKTDNDVINSFLKRQKEGTLDTFSVDDMKSLALALFVEVEKNAITRITVGGQTQYGVFSANGPIEWKPFSQAKSHSPLNTAAKLIIGAKFTENRDTREAGYIHEIHDVGVVTITASPGKPGIYVPHPAQVIILDSIFQKVAVALDGNSFVGNSFESATLVSKSRFALVAQGNKCENSVLVAGGKTLQLPEACDSFLVEGGRK